MTGSGPTDADTTAEQLGLLETMPVEDSGSETLDRFEFQLQCVSRYCIDLLDPAADLDAVVCEWHTDALLLRPRGRVAMVSVKHRESTRGPWTVYTLCDPHQGGLGTLFSRWKDNGRPSECRFVSNAGLDSATTALARACAGQSDQLDDLAVNLAGRLKQDVHEVREFLRALRFEVDLPHRQHIEAVNVVERMEPLMRRCLRDVRSANDVYGKLVNLVRIASRSDLPPDSAQASSPDRLDETYLRSAAVRSRRIEPEHLRAILTDAAVVEAAPPQPVGSTSTRLTNKLRRGGVPETAVQTAARCRMAWTRYEAQHRPPVPDLSPPEEDLRVIVSHAAAMAHTAAEAAADGSGYGSRMLLDIEGRLKETSEAHAVHPSVLLGLVFDLTAACEIWWSERYNVDEAVATELAVPLGGPVIGPTA